MSRIYHVVYNGRIYRYELNDHTPINSLQQIKTIADSKDKILMLHHRINGKLRFIYLINGDRVGDALTNFINDYESQYPKIFEMAIIELVLTYESWINRDLGCYSYHRTMSNGSVECYGFVTIDELLTAIRNEPARGDGVIVQSHAVFKHAIAGDDIISKPIMQMPF